MQTNIIGNISLYDMMFYFFIYSFLGWCAEVVYATLKTGKFINRGFLNGPVCPIYGVGMAVCVLLLNKVASMWWLLFIVGCLFSSALELVTGFVLEKLFKTKWWDYSKEPFNLKGYVCLRFSLLWGLAILLMFKTLVPITDSIIELIPVSFWGTMILIVFWVVFIADLCSTALQLKGLKKNLKELLLVGEKMKEGSNIIGEKISDATITVAERIGVASERIKNSRLGKAFPNMLKKCEELKDKISEKIDNIVKK